MTFHVFINNKKFIVNPKVSILQATVLYVMVMVIIKSLGEWMMLLTLAVTDLAQQKLKTRL